MLRYVTCNYYLQNTDYYQVAVTFHIFYKMDGVLLEYLYCEFIATPFLIYFVQGLKVFERCSVCVARVLVILNLERERWI